jgi:hypothetical protein
MKQNRAIPVNLDDWLKSFRSSLGEPLFPQRDNGWFESCRGAEAGCFQSVFHRRAKQ